MLRGDSVISFGDYYLKELLFSFKWPKFISELHSYSKIMKKNFLRLFFKYLIFYSLPQNQRRKKLINSDMLILNNEIQKSSNVEKFLKKKYSLKVIIQKVIIMKLLTTTDRSTVETLDSCFAAFSIELVILFWIKDLLNFVMQYQLI